MSMINLSHDVVVLQRYAFILSGNPYGSTDKEKWIWISIFAFNRGGVPPVIAIKKGVAQDPPSLETIFTITLGLHGMSDGSLETSK